MKKIVLWSLLVLTGLTHLKAQSVGLSAGLNSNLFFDYKKQESHFRSEYSPDFGYSLEMSFTKYQAEKNTKFRASLFLDNYKGTFLTSDGGLGGSITTKGEVRKTTVGVGLFPIVFSLAKNLEINVGGEVSLKIFDRTTGHKFFWLLGTPGSMAPLNSVSFHNNVVAGLSVRLSYDFRLEDKLFIHPFYKFYLGLTNEFHNTEADIKSMRHHAGVGIIRKFD